MKRLRDIEAPLANFLASGILALKEKLGPILWQFPPNFIFDEEKLETILRPSPARYRIGSEVREKSRHTGSRTEL